MTDASEDVIQQAARIAATTGAAGGIAVDAFQYVSAGGNDTNHGLTRSVPKLTLEAAIAALPTDGTGTKYGAIFIGAGTFTPATVLNITERMSIIGAGSRLTTINCNLNGDHIRATMVSWNTTTPQAGILSGFKLVGNAGASAVGIHMGDIVGLEIHDLWIQDFTGTNGVAIWQDNIQSNGNSERTVIEKVGISNCTFGIRQTVNGGNVSFDYQRWLDLKFTLMADGQTAICQEGNAQLLRCVVTFSCNVRGSGSTTCVWEVKSTAQVDQCRIDFDAEQTTGTGAVGIRVATGATFKYFGGSHINMAGLLLLLTGAATYGFVATSEAGLQTHSYSSGTLTVNADIGNAHDITLTADMAAALVIGHPALGQELILTFVQNATGGWLIQWPTNCVFVNGVAPYVFGATDRVSVTFAYDGTSWNERSRSVPWQENRYNGGDGSDGVGAFDGSATPNGTTKNSSTLYTLNRDCYFTTMTVAAGVAVKAFGYRIFAQSYIFIAATAVIHNDGHAASTSTAGTNYDVGTLGTAAGAGTAGVSGAGAGTAPGTISCDICTTSAGNVASGGTGGAASGGGTGGGTAGGQINMNATNGSPRNLQQAFSLHSILTSNTAMNFGNGGAAGTSTTSSTSGGSGGGAGCVALYSPVIHNNGTIRAKGGVGGAASGAGTGAGGGGGGGGGAIVLVYSRLSGSGGTDVTGGAGGALQGAGAAGGTGASGLVYSVTA